MNDDRKRPDQRHAEVPQPHVLAATANTARRDARAELALRYEKSCDACSHYSQVLSTIRLATITQGLVLAAACAYVLRGGAAELLLTTDKFRQVYATCLFCQTFSFVMSFLADNYLKHFLGHVRFTAACEAKMFGAYRITIDDDDESPKSKTPSRASEDRANNCDYYGPWDHYLLLRYGRYGKMHWDLLATSGIVLLIMLSVGLIGAYSAFTLALTSHNPWIGLLLLPLIPFPVISLFKVWRSIGKHKKSHREMLKRRPACDTASDVASKDEDVAA